MWAVARYDLGLSTDEFYALTPRQYSLLIDAHRRGLAHREMCQAFTTASIINYAFSPPKDPVKPSEFMPNFIPERPESNPPQRAKPLTDAQIMDWQARVIDLAARLKNGTQ